MWCRSAAVAGRVQDSLWWLVALTVAHGITCQLVSSTFKLNYPDMTLTGDNGVIDRGTNTSKIGCAIWCLQSVNCTHFSWDPLSRLCTLSDHVVHVAEDLMERVGVDTYAAPTHVVHGGTVPVTMATAVPYDSAISTGKILDMASFPVDPTAPATAAKGGNAVPASAGPAPAHYTGVDVSDPLATAASPSNPPTTAEVPCPPVSVDVNPANKMCDLQNRYSVTAALRLSSSGHSVLFLENSMIVFCGTTSAIVADQGRTCHMPRALSEIDKDGIIGRPPDAAVGFNYSESSTRYYLFLGECKGTIYRSIL